MEKLIKRYVDEKGKEWGTYKIECPKCGGMGFLERIDWKMTDNEGRCFKCMGTGYLIKDKRILTEKEKIQRGKAKARREEKKETERLEKIRVAEEKKQEEINNNPYTFICIDKDSYSKKEMLKENGYRWRCGKWIGTEKIEGVELLQVVTTDIISDTLELEYDATKIALAIQKHNTENSSHVGTVGEKIEQEVTLSKELYFRTNYGYNTRTYMYIMKNAQGNTLVWKTSKSLDVNEGEKFIITGTIKGHDTYDGIKQTILTRCKIS